MTIKMTTHNWINNWEPIKIGEIYKVMMFENELKDEPITYRFLSDIETGWPGVLDSGVKCYHGWRGTENNIRKEALGVYQVLDIVEQKNGLYRIKLSADLHPDWE